VGKGEAVAVGTVGDGVGLDGIGVLVGVPVGGAGVAVKVLVGIGVGMAILPPNITPALLNPIRPTILRMVMTLPRVYPIKVSGLMPSRIKVIVPVITITTK
jgi:hypothetical protein